MIERIILNIIISREYIVYNIPMDRKEEYKSENHVFYMSDIFNIFCEYLDVIDIINVTTVNKTIYRNSC